MARVSLSTVFDVRTGQTEHLELARAGVVALDRDAPWTPIRVLHRDDHSAVQGAVGPLA